MAKGDPAGSGTQSIVPASEVLGARASVDILFMIDNSSSMTSMQQKLVTQIPMFLTTLQSAARPLSDFHIAVVSSDLGAPGDSTSAIGCTADGDQGIFQSQPRGKTARVSAGAGAPASISNARRGWPTTPGKLTDVLARITPLGANGCGFEHQLASVARALGADADSQPRPPTLASCARTLSWPSSPS